MLRLKVAKWSSSQTIPNVIYKIYEYKSDCPIEEMKWKSEPKYEHLQKYVVHLRLSGSLIWVN